MSSKKTKRFRWFTAPAYQCLVCKTFLWHQERSDFVFQDPSELKLEKEFDKSERLIRRHYMDCYRTKESTDYDRKAIFLEMQDMNFDGVFRVVIAMKPDATLLDLDGAVRKIWMEPCECNERPPHGAQMWVLDENVMSTLDAKFGFFHPKVVQDGLNTGALDGRGRHMVDYGMGAALADENGVLRYNNQQILYMYDCGRRATRIAVCFRGVLSVNFTVSNKRSGDNWKVLLQNEPPKIPCFWTSMNSEEKNANGPPCEKDNRAKLVVRDFWFFKSTDKTNSSVATFTPDRFFCSEECAKKKKYIKRDLLPVCNSPRMGCCCYKEGT